MNWYVYASNNPLNRVDPTGMVDVFYDGSVCFDPNDSNIYFIPHYNQYKDSSWIDDIGSKVLLFESDNMDYSVALSMAGFDVSKIDEKAISAAKKLIESKGYTWKDGKYKKDGILGKLFNKAFLGEAAGHDKTDSLFNDVMNDVNELISEVKNTPENREQAAGNFTQYAVTASLFSFNSQSGSNTQNQKPVQTKPFRGVAGNAINNVDDIMSNPNMLKGKSLTEVQNSIGNTNGWVNDVMRKSTRAKGWVFREMNSAGTDFTGRIIQYHPGTPRHFGGAPYWKVSSGSGTFRIPLVE